MPPLPSPVSRLGLVLGLLGAPLRAADSTAPAGGAAVVLEPFTVNERAEQSFGFNVRVTRDSETHRVERIVVDSVRPHSPAAKAGLKPLTAILRIDGRPVEEFQGSFEAGSDLNRALMNRPDGARLTLEILSIGESAGKVVTLVESRGELQYRGYGMNGN
jgi:C-terminal processing protease CtpA/Prc